MRHGAVTLGQQQVAVAVQQYTSVGLSGGTTGITVSGSPITTSGTITLGGTLAITNGGTIDAITPQAAIDELTEASGATIGIRTYCRC